MPLSDNNEANYILCMALKSLVFIHIVSTIVLNVTVFIQVKFIKYRMHESQSYNIVIMKALNT